MNRRTLLRSLAGVLFQKRQMPLTFNWIDQVAHPFAFDNLDTLTAAGAGQQGALKWLLVRKASTLYVLLFKASIESLPSATTSCRPLLYVSTDAGLTWTLLDKTCPVSPSPFENPGIANFYLDADGNLSLEYAADGQASVIIQRTAFDLSGLTWSSVTNIGGGFNQNQHVEHHPPYGAVLEFPRSDGSRVIAYECESGSHGDQQVRVLKRSASGTWTQLALLTYDPSDTADVALLNGAIRNDIVYVFVGKTDFSGHTDLQYISVSTADAVTALATISAMGGTSASSPSQATGRCDFSADGNTLGFAWVHGSAGGPTLSYMLHVALGNLSIDPLNPAWTVENTGYQIPPGPSSPTPAVSFEGGNTVNAYWLDRFGQDPDTLLKASLLRSTRTSPGAWGAPATMYGPAYLYGFDLLNAFTNGVGVLIHEWQNPHNMVGYTGPAMGGRFTFASSKSGRSRIAKAS